MNLPAVMTIMLIASAVLIILFSLGFRYRRRELQHQERLAAIEKGVPAPPINGEQRAAWTPRVYLLRGLMWLFSGIGLTLFLSAVAISSSHTKSVEYRLMEAQRLKQMGATEEQIRQANNEPRTDGMSWGVALIGLVPVGVGLAYLVFYRLEGRNLAAVARADQAQ